MLFMAAQRSDHFGEEHTAEGDDECSREHEQRGVSLSQVICDAFSEQADAVDEDEGDRDQHYAAAPDEPSVLYFGLEVVPHVSSEDQSGVWSSPHLEDGFELVPLPVSLFLLDGQLSLEEPVHL